MTALLNHLKSKIGMSAALVLAFLSVFPAAAGQDALSYMRPEHRKVIQSWLAGQPHLRVAEEKDCYDGGPEDLRDFCVSEFTRIRKGTSSQKAQQSYQPYYQDRDFNGDGAGDFAVCFIDTNRHDDANLTLAIFNGPFKDSRSAVPAYLEKDLMVLNRSITPAYSPEDDRELTFCEHDTDDCLWLVPSGASYVEKQSEE